MTPPVSGQSAEQHGRHCDNMENDCLLRYKGYTARPEYSAEDRVFYETILGISDMVDFQSESAKDLEDEFRKAVDDYLELCAEIGKEPQKKHSGLFNSRIPSDPYREYSGAKIIPVSEFEADAEKYVEMAQTCDILIIENGKRILKLTAAGKQTAQG